MSLAQFQDSLVKHVTIATSGYNKSCHLCKRERAAFALQAWQIKDAKRIYPQPMEETIFP